MIESKEISWRKIINREKIRIIFPEELKEGIYWCDICNVPLLSPFCDIHGFSPNYMSIDLKPVFKEEKEIFEKDLDLKLPDHRFLFRSNNRIICSGKVLLHLKLHYDTKQTKSKKYLFAYVEEKKLIEKRLESLYFLKEENSEKYIEKIYRSNHRYLSTIIEQTSSFIQNIMEKYSSLEKLISFSGGKDSTVVAKIIKDLGYKIPLFFADTTLEYPETYMFIKRFAQLYEFDLLDYTKYKSNQDFYQLCDELGPPSMFYRWCCTVFKAYPVNKYYQELEGKVLTFDGIRKKESPRRREYEQISKIKKIPKQIAVYPIFEWKELDVWLYILKNNIIYNPIYDLGISRVGCYLCPASSPYNCHLRKRTQYPIWEKFEKVLYNYAKRAKRKTTNGTYIQWVDENYWRLRRPKKDKLNVGSVKKMKEKANLSIESSSKICSSDNSFVYSFGKENVNNISATGRFSSEDEINKSMNVKVDRAFLEFLKPFGKIIFKDIEAKMFFYIEKNNPIQISGILNSSKLKISFNSNEFLSTKKLFDKQIMKAINCVGCGGCIGMCPNGAIEIKNGSFFINELLCNNCLVCVRSNFTNGNCIAVSFNLRKKVLEKS
ncbi:MAG: phosphoadenosine phosphosulfate reductase domain-containing protein [Candidatus Heimdallarchaeaceae archaeon]